MFSQLVRYYGISPNEIMETSSFLLGVLYEQMPAIQAAEELTEITGNIMPHAEARDRKRHTRILLRRAGYKNKPEPQKIEVIEYNPDKAREYFARRGAKVE